MTLVVDTLQELNLESLFDIDSHIFDLREGVIWNPARTRMCLLSTDLLKGIYQALLEEAGPAWKLIFKSCGKIWGDRLARRLDRDLEVLRGRSLRDLTVGEFAQVVEGYFLVHGWGHMTIDLDTGADRGVLVASMSDSIFADIIDDESAMADPMIAGILGSLISYLAGRELDCLQTCCRTKGHETSRFLISSPGRIERGQEHIDQGKSHDEIFGIV